ncbi:MAG: copper transporter [Aeromicrobium erythreum]
MITFRYHLVSLAAVLLALAAGVTLGSGLLQDTGDRLSGDSTGADPALSRFEAGYAARTGPDLLDGTLSKRSVAVLSLPGARAAEVSSVVADLRSAGATVTARGELTGKLLDSSERQFAESVAQESAGDVQGVDSTGSSYSRVGAALGRAFLGKAGGAVDGTATSISTAFDEAGLLSWSSKPSRMADLTVVVAGPSRAGDGAEVVEQLAAAFDRSGKGVVVAGPSASSEDGGLVAGLRGAGVDDRVSTVDVTDSAAGRVVTVLALASEAAGRSGSWGTSRSADGAVPRS